MSVSLRGAQAAFALAIQELNEEPTGESVVRYLVASRKLEQAKDEVRQALRAVAGQPRLVRKGSV